jgi:CRISPR/Cas system CSM-associated protein Csm3 (group 7 of RAMP superfamily)
MIIEYELNVESEYHIGIGLQRPGVADQSLVTRSDETLVIPAEHFRGLVRDACTQILHWLGREKCCCEASLQKGPRQEHNKVLSTCGLNFRGENDPCVLCRLFGTTFLPRHYHFFDATLKEEEKTKSQESEEVSQEGKTSKDKRRISVHNRVEPATGRVPEEPFFSFEVGAAETTFTGRIERASSQKNPCLLQEEVGLLLAGLRLVERVGGRSGRGWGRCNVQITRLTCDDKETPPENIAERVDAWLKDYLKPCNGEGGKRCSGYV